MTEMVERTARVLFEWQYGHNRWEDAAPEEQQDCREAARVAIAAMREPSEATVSDLPANEKYPIRFLTGISYANSSEEQERWQSFHDRMMDKFLASSAKAKAFRRTVDLPPSKAMKDFMGRNMFVRWFS